MRLTAHLALINFLKGMIGPGCFSLPLAFREAGLWTGFMLVFVVGVITCICMAKIVKCSQFLTSRNPKVQSLNYAEMADESFRQSFNCLRKRGHIARRFVNLCLSSLVLGICSIYYIFVVDHIREVLNHLLPNLEISKLTCLVVAIAPFILLSYIRSIRLMSFVSLAGNIFMALSIVLIFSQLLPAPHLSAELPWSTDFHGIILATGAVMYSFEGHPLILPLENKMKHPSEMRGWTGVLSTGISLVTIIYAACGFFGYVTYGKDVKESITLNMDDGL
ncbi:transmembrane amino acid transporter protein [Oesophagostomum dentatum]|uniref:Transmembrane amino acid transporter protein n=1 Tax=Oesophagostomum dentatum TaxID=61180 RepID=A0A0B1T9N9_OESDE|nr:transmembrane amino acid transporter protein [Oesophagostomum dentatum]